MSDHLEPWQQEPDPYWDSERVNDRDEHDLFLRWVEVEEQDRLTRDVGESGQ